jgi:DNA (cytosine-5)-methyltransferase 1
MLGMHPLMKSRLPTAFCGRKNTYLRANMGDNQIAMAKQMAVRRLTPVECERLQGFPDNYTNIPWRKKPESPDGPRYKAMGNSMAVPVMKWIGKR